MVESAVVYAVVVRLGTVRTEGLRLKGRVVGEGSSIGGVADTACEVFPSSHGSLLSVVPGAIFVGRVVRTPGFRVAVMVGLIRAAVPVRREEKPGRLQRACPESENELAQTVGESSKAMNLGETVMESCETT